MFCVTKDKLKLTQLLSSGVSQNDKNLTYMKVMKTILRTSDKSELLHIHAQNQKLSVPQ